MNHAHEAADSVMEWAHENAAELKHFTAHRALPLPTVHFTAPQGRPEQGWQVRGEQPQPAEAATELGADAGDDFANADRVFWVYVLCGLSVWALVITIWMGVA